MFMLFFMGLMSRLSLRLGIDVSPAEIELRDSLDRAERELSREHSLIFRGIDWDRYNHEIDRSGQLLRLYPDGPYKLIFDERIASIRMKAQQILGYRLGAD